MTWNDPATDQGFWLRYISEAPVDGPARGELWFARFDPKRSARTFGIHKHFAARRSIASRRSRCTIGDAQLGHDHAIGELAGGGHDVHWDLRWEPAEHVLRHLPDFMYSRGGLGETTVQSPNPRVPLSGTLVVDGETIDVRSRGRRPDARVGQEARVLVDVGPLRRVRRRARCRARADRRAAAAPRRARCRRCPGSTLELDGEQPPLQPVPPRVAQSRDLERLRRRVHARGR